MKTLVEYYVEKHHFEQNDVWVLQDSEDNLAGEVENWLRSNHRDWFEFAEGEITVSKNTVISDLKDYTDYIEAVYEFTAKDSKEAYDSTNWKTFERSEIESLVESLIEKNEEDRRWLEFEKKQLKLAI